MDTLEEVTVLSLPPELLLDIISRLIPSVRDILDASEVCRVWHATITTDALLWKKVCQAYYLDTGKDSFSNISGGLLAFVMDGPKRWNSQCKAVQKSGRASPADILVADLHSVLRTVTGKDYVPSDGYDEMDSDFVAQVKYAINGLVHCSDDLDLGMVAKYLNADTDVGTLLDEACDQCFKRLEKGAFGACSKCRTARYCGREC